MAEKRLLRHTSSRAITLPQFQESLQRLWLEARHSWAGRRAKTRLPRRLGLAVSGGADSMALAYLCKQWEQSQHDDVSVTAFVVDHKAREESTREALMVSQFLADIGVNAQILELSWPPANGGGAVTAFETHARRLRFQALGTACRDNQIEALLMGHHQDDSVETTIWRLCSGARGAGLAGIPPMTRIPECHGIYGVAESGSSTVLHPKQMSSHRFHTSLKKELRAIPSDRSDENEHLVPTKSNFVPMSTGGVLICRPLLNFPKTRILATCHENLVPYVTDPTNFDPTLTPRNAIRSLISSHHLPRALQTPSILSLINSSQNLLQNSNDLSNDLLSSCKILDTNLATGMLAIRFPSVTKQNNPLASKLEQAAPHRTHQIQTLTLRRITELISPLPESHFPLRSFEKFVHRVFPSSSQDASSTPSPVRQAFTLGGVLCQPIHWISSPDTQKSREPGGATAESPSTNENNAVWLLSRQPYMHKRIPVLQQEISIPPVQPAADGHNQFSSKTTSNPAHNYTQWALWDNRYWFRFALTSRKKDSSSPGVGSNNSDKETQKISLVIRPFQPSDLEKARQVSQEIQQRLGHPWKRKDPALVAFLDRLARVAPGQVRYTIPLLEVILADETGVERQIPLALPTLHLWLPNSRKSLSKILSETTVHWEWMYKMIDTEPLRLMGSL